MGKIEINKLSARSSKGRVEESAEAYNFRTTFETSLDLLKRISWKLCSTATSPDVLTICSGIHAGDKIVNFSYGKLVKSSEMITSILDKISDKLVSIFLYALNLFLIHKRNQLCKHYKCSIIVLENLLFLM